MKTIEQLKAEAAERGIVEGARIRCAGNGWSGTVKPIGDWTYRGNGILCVGVDDAHGLLFASHIDGRWAEVITPAPSKDEGLKEGDSVKCGPAMRAAIVELAKELGLDTTGLNNEHPLIWGRGERLCYASAGLTCKSVKSIHTPEAFISKMRVTAALPKPIKIGSDKVEFREGSIKVGCTTIDNAIVRAIASKLIGE